MWDAQGPLTLKGAGKVITLKQVEALYWIAELGSFEAAAMRLNTTQSAISKRIQELESRFDLEIFDRSRRTACLTPKGEEILQSARQLLDMRDGLLVQLGAQEAMFHRLRLGVTELTALTWLPILADRLRKRFPKLEIEPEVGLSRALYERLADRTIDLIIVPDVFTDPRFSVTSVGKVENAWMYADGVMPDANLAFIGALRRAGYRFKAVGAARAGHPDHQIHGHSPLSNRSKMTAVNLCENPYNYHKAWENLHNGRLGRFAAFRGSGSMRKLVGGGAYLFGAEGDVAIDETYPANATTWHAKGVEITGTAVSWQLTAYAVCANANS